MVKAFTARAKSRKGSTDLNKVIFSQLEKIWKECIKAYLHAAVISGAVKVDSGMSKGSYLHLARLVRMYSQVRGSISPGHGKNIKSSGNNIGMQPSKGSRKSIAAGERVGKEKTFVEYGTVQDPKFLFEFEINVFQYLVNENGRSGTLTNLRTK